MERLDASIEHLGDPGDGGHVRDGQAGLAQGRRRPAGRDELEAQRIESGPERGEAGLVGDRKQGPAWRQHRAGRLQRIDAHAALVHGQGAGCEQEDGLGEEALLHEVQTGEEPLLVIVRPDVDRLLEDDRTAVEVLVHEVHGDAGRPHAVGERVADRMRAGEGGEERGMDVQDLPAEGSKRPGPDHAHVARQHHDVRPGAHQCRLQGTVETVRVGALEERRGQSFRLGPGERRTRPVGRDEHDLDGQPASARRIDQGAQVRARAAHAHGHARRAHNARPLSGPSS